MKKNTAFIMSSIISLSFGNYDGDMSIKNLLKKGNFGFGTFSELDGEMVVLDGKCYQVKSNRQVLVDTKNLTTPHATVVKFKANKKEKLKEGNFEDLKKELHTLIEEMNPNFMYAIKVTGKFNKITTRSVTKQSKPYKKLSEVVDKQEVFDFDNQTGTLVGFYTPFNLNNLAVEGLHFHYIDDTKSCGGHVFSFEAEKLVINICQITNVEHEIGTNDFEIKHSMDKIQEEIKKAEVQKK